MTEAASIDPEPKAPRRRARTGPTSDGTLLHHVLVAARHLCQVVFSVRSGDPPDDEAKPHVTYSRAVIPVPPGALPVAWSCYRSLLAEAEALCGGVRQTTSVRPDWLPAGVEEITIRWIAPVTGRDDDTFALVCDFTDEA